MKKNPQQDRYLALSWLDEYAAPTGYSASYFAECPDDREYVLSLWNQYPSFRFIGDFADLPKAHLAIAADLKQRASMIPVEERKKWPTREDYDYVITCDICHFTYCPRLPKDAEAYAKNHKKTAFGSSR